MRRSLALISEGMLSTSSAKAITLASIGWLVVAVIPINGRNQNPYVRIESDGGRYKKDEKERWDKTIAEEDEIIIAFLKEAVKIINF